MFVAEEVAVARVAALREPIAELRRVDPDLADQARRAATSIALNLGEGLARTGRDRPFHFRVARGSARELRVALRVAVAWGHIAEASLTEPSALLDRLLGLLWGLCHAPSRPRP